MFDSFKLLLAAVDEYGSARIPYDYISKNGFSAGKWVAKRRRDYKEKRNSMTSDRIKKLESLRGWVWRAK